MPMLRVLGSLTFERDGSRVGLGGRRQRSVLARLAMAGGDAVSPDRLIFDLWGDSPPREALSSLRAYVSRLRVALGPGHSSHGASAILGDPGGYRLAMPSSWVDAWVFEDAVARAEAEPRTNAAERIRIVEATLTLWHGSSYGEFASEGWARLEIARLEDLHSAARELRGQTLIDLGRDAEAARVLDALVRDEPLRESAWAALAVALVRAGRQADAMASIRRARATLSDETGLTLGPELRTLEGDILRQRITSPRWQGGAFDPADASRGIDAFVGRDAELERLTELGRRASTGRSVVCVIDGEAGAGKSRLAAEFVGRLRRDGWAGAVGRCVPETGALAAFPWMEIMGSLETLAPPIAAAIPAPDGPVDEGDADPFVQRYRRHRRIGDQLRRVASRAPLVLIVDDIQFADIESALILTHVIQSTADSAILFLCIRRTMLTEDDPSPARRAALASVSAAAQASIRLGGISARETARVVENISGRSIEPGDAEAIRERTAGNMLFIRQVAALLAGADVTTAMATAPVALVDVVRRRLAGIRARSLDVLALMALTGRDVDAGLLIEFAGSEPAALEALDDGLAGGILVEPRSDTIAFAHDIVRESIVASLSAMRRSALHTRVASALLARSPGDHSSIAFHLAQADRAESADAFVDHATRAAEAEEARFAFSAAADWWGRIAEVLRSADGAPEQPYVGARIRMTRALALAGDAADARDSRAALLSEVGASIDVELLSRIIVAYDVPSLWLNQEYGMVDDELVTAIERCLAETGGTGVELRCRLLCCLSLELEWSPSERGRDAAEEALRLARSGGDEFLVSTALGCVFRHSYRPGELERRRSIAAECRSTAERSGHIPHQILAGLMCAECATARGELGEADRLHDEIRRLARTYHLKGAFAVSSWYDGQRAMCRGRFDEARRAYASAAEASLAARVWEEQQAWVAGGAISIAMQEDRGEDILDIARLAERQWPGPGGEALAYALDAAGEPGAARDIEMVEIPADAAYLLGVTWRAFAGLRLGDELRMSWCYAALLPYEDEVAAGDTGAVALDPVAKILGDLAARLGDRAAARRHYGHALTVASRARSTYWERSTRAALKRLA